jgi:sugar (pentulose or hexulose) kinase
MAKILVIDLGTTYFKVCLFDREGRLIAAVQVPVPIEPRPPGRCELDALRFEPLLCEAIGRLRDGDDCGLGDVEAVTFASQTNSFLLLGADDRPLVPLILWPDRRAAEYEDQVQAWSSRPGFAAGRGVPRASCQFMAAKLLWLAGRQPGTWRRTRRLCLISDFLTFLWTGCHVTEAGTAGLTGLVDIHRLAFCDDAQERFGLPPAWLPRVVRAGTDLGPLEPQAADRLGLPRRCRFVVGCLDQYAGAIGAGNVAAGGLSETTGTVLATVRCSDRYRPQPPPVFQGPAFAPGLYYQMVFGEVSAACLEWYRRQLPDAPDFQQLTALAEGIEPGAEGLRLRAGTPPGSVAAAFEGIGPGHGRGHCVRAILEAVSVALRDQVACLAGQRGAAEVRSAGGAARSDAWLQIKADLLGRPFLATECPEVTSLGSAILAEAALGGAGVGQVAAGWVRPRRRYDPDPERHRRYNNLFPGGA